MLHLVPWGTSRSVASQLPIVLRAQPLEPGHSECYRACLPGTRPGFHLQHSGGLASPVALASAARTTHRLQTGPAAFPWEVPFTAAVFREKTACLTCSEIAPSTELYDQYLAHLPVRAQLRAHPELPFGGHYRAEDMNEASDSKLGPATKGKPLISELPELPFGALLYSPHCLWDPQHHPDMTCHQTKLLLSLASAASRMEWPGSQVAHSSFLKDHISSDPPPLQSKAAATGSQHPSVPLWKEKGRDKPSVWDCLPGQGCELTPAQS